MALRLQLPLALSLALLLTMAVTSLGAILPGLAKSPINIDVTESGGNPTAFVEFGFDLNGVPVNPQPGTPGEDVANLINDLVLYDGPAPNRTKWNDAQGDTIMLPVHVRLDQPRAVQAYTLTSANDNSERDPWRWRVLGTNVNNPVSVAQSTVLDERTAVEFTDRHQTQVFQFLSQTVYSTYRFEFETELVAGGPIPEAPNSIQLAEVELFEGISFLAAELTIGRGSGSIRLTNIGTSALSMIGYSITSPAERLDSDAWLSIADNYDGDDGAELDSDTWIRLTAPGAQDNLSEVENPNGTGGVLLAVEQSIDLGSAWVPSPIEDVMGEILLADGTTRSLAVQYIDDSAALPGDYNGDNIVNAADYTVWRDLLGSSTQLQNEGPGVTPGIVTQHDYNTWRANFGDALGSGSSTGSSLFVPEPAGGMLAVFAAGLCLAARRRRQVIEYGQHCLRTGALSIAGLCSACASVASTVDRKYQFGDDPQENAVAEHTVGQSSVVANHTLDSASQGSYFDIMQHGSPIYVNTSFTNRPGAGRVLGYFSSSSSSTPTAHSG